MTRFSPRTGELDTRVWSSATWSAPLITQAILIVLLLSWWALTNQQLSLPGPAMFAASAAITTLITAPLGAILLRSASARSRGIGLSIAGALVVVLIGGLLYGLLVIRW